MAEIFDLFGDPIPDNWGRRGRPPHLRTTENINKVMMLLALGWSNPRIANALGISQPTFLKHYFCLTEQVRENARDALDASYAMKLWKEVQDGNVGAMRLWAAFLERNDRMEVERSMASAPAASADKPTERVGKKQLDDQRAIDADADLMSELENEASQNAAAVH